MQKTAQGGIPGNGEWTGPPKGALHAPLKAADTPDLQTVLDQLRGNSQPQSTFAPQRYGPGGALGAADVSTPLAKSLPYNTADVAPAFAAQMVHDNNRDTFSGISKTGMNADWARFNPTPSQNVEDHTQVQHLPEAPRDSADRIYTQGQEAFPLERLKAVGAPQSPPRVPTMGMVPGDPNAIARMMQQLPQEITGQGMFPVGPEGMGIRG